MTFKLSAYHVATDVLPTDASAGDMRIVFGTRTGKSIRLSDELYQRLRLGQIDNLSDRTLMQLFELELIVPADQMEFSTILARNKASVSTSTNLSIVIQPTANCQLGCTYCGQSHSKKKASDEVEDLVIGRIDGKLASGKYRSLSMEWFGAEPLMAFSQIMRMSDRLLAICSERRVNYNAHMITNGLSFKPLMAKALVSKGCKNFQITLDGTSITHDKLRPTKSGRPTFDIILGNIVAVCNDDDFTGNGGQVVVRININKTSALEVRSLISLLASYGLHRRGVILDFQPVIDWGGNGAAIDSFSADDYARMEIDWILYAIELGFEASEVLPRRRTQPCMVVEPDGEVYDADGDIYPCYEFPYTPAFEGPAYRVGNLKTVDVESNPSPITRGWFDDIEGDIAPCKKCNLFPVCGGGCPKKWLHGEVACPPFKKNISDRIIIDYLSKKRVLVSSPASV